MKNKSIIAFLLLVLVVVVSSCASQKHGCPMSNGAANNTKFRA